MTTYFSQHPFSTDLSDDLARRINTVERRREDAQRAYDDEIRDLGEQYTAEVRRHRPQYPTQQQRALLEMIAESIHRDTTAAASIMSGPVRYDAYVGRINIYAMAPYQIGSSSRMWLMEPEEITALAKLLRDLQLRITREWSHEDGHAFIVRSALV